MQASGFGVYDLGFRVQALGFGVYDVGCRVEDLGCRLEGLGFGLSRIGAGHRHDSPSVLIGNQLEPEPQTLNHQPSTPYSKILL